MNNLFLHEAVLIIAGVVLWQIEQQIFYRRLTIRARVNEVGRCLKYAFFILIIDDEVLLLIKHQYNITIELESVHYVALGLFIDFIRTMFNKYMKKD